MQIQVLGRHMPVSDALKDYATEKVGRVAKVLDRDDLRVEVKLHVEKNRAIEKKDVAEITAFVGERVIRAEEAAPEMLEAIGLASDKFERQMKKLKGRMNDRHNGKGHRTTEIVKTVPTDEQLLGTAEIDMGKVVRTKDVELKPMSEEEAILQLELLGHDFLMFTSAESGAVSVLYRRYDGDFGVLQPSE